MVKRGRIVAIGCLLGLGTIAFVGYGGWRFLQVSKLYEGLDWDYQRAMDPLRMKHADEIVALVLEYAETTGHFPFAERAVDRPFMVFIGHSVGEEDALAKDPVLGRGGRWSNSPELESELTTALGRRVTLPRDPQKVPTYAPNVYVYSVSGDQMTVAVHLFEAPKDKETVPYEWRGGRFFAYGATYGPKTEGNPRNSGVVKPR